MGFSYKKPMMEEVYIWPQSIILEAKQASEGDASELEDDQLIYVLRPLNIVGTTIHIHLSHNYEMKMVPTQELPNLKLKRTARSFLLKCVPYNKDGILGLPPNSTQTQRS